MPEGAPREKGLHQLIRFVGPSQALQPALTLGISVIIARSLGPEGRGAYGLVVSAIAVLPPLIGIGFEFAVRYWAARGEVDRLSLLRTATAIASVIGALCASVVFTSWYVGYPTWLVPANLSPLGAGAMTASFFLIALRGFWANYHTGLERYGFSVWGINTATAIQLAALAAIWQMSEVSLDTVMVAFLLQFVATAVLFPILSWRDLLGAARSPFLSRQVLRDMLRYARWQYLSSLLMQTNMRVNIFILVALSGMYETGLYTAVLGPAGFLGLIAAPFTLVVSARTARRDDDPGFPGRVAGALRAIVVLMSCCALLAAAIAPIVLPFLFGDRFAGSIRPFWILLPGVIFQSLVRVVIQFLAGAKRPEWNSRISGVAAVLTIGLNVLLIPSLGATGAAIGFSTAFFAASFVAGYGFLSVSGLALGELVTFRRSDWVPLARVLGVRLDRSAPR